MCCIRKTSQNADNGGLSRHDECVIDGEAANCAKFHPLVVTHDKEKRVFTQHLYLTFFQFHSMQIISVVLK